MSRERRSHGVKLDGSPICGTRVKRFTINPITPTCARCVAAGCRQTKAAHPNRKKPLCPQCWHRDTSHDATGCHALRSCGPSGTFRCNCRAVLAPLRALVDQFEDWRGKMQELECGHIIRGRGCLPMGVGFCRCDACLETGTGGEVVALHDIRCGCYRCTNRSPKP